MAVKEIADSVSDVVRERAKSPLFGSFLLSWLLWNWRAILFLLYSQDDLTIANRVEIVGEMFTIWRSAIWPALTAIALIVFLPPLSIAASLLWSLFEKHRKTIDLRIRQITPITAEERRGVVLAMQEQQERFDKALQMLDTEHRTARQDSDRQIKKLSDEVASLRRALRDCELQRDDYQEKAGGYESNILELRERGRLRQRFESAWELEDPQDADSQPK